jgi:GT2 family glycosyltransferase
VVGNVQLSHATGAVDHTGIVFNAKGKPEHRTDRGWPGQAVRRVDAVTGACLALRRDLWNQLGGFDEGFRNGCEDIDLCLRAGRAGWRIYVALRSVVRHHISTSLGRKQRDEQNTRRLFLAWRNAIAPRITAHTARACLAASWDEPRDYPDALLARDAFLHLMGWPASARVLAASQAMLDLELAHWAELLDGAAIRPRAQIAWQFSAPRAVARPEI